MLSRELTINYSVPMNKDVPYLQIGQRCFHHCGIQTQVELGSQCSDNLWSASLTFHFSEKLRGQVIQNSIPRTKGEKCIRVYAELVVSNKPIAIQAFQGTTSENGSDVMAQFLVDVLDIRRAYGGIEVLTRKFSVVLAGFSRCKAGVSVGINSRQQLIAPCVLLRREAGQGVRQFHVCFKMGGSIQKTHEGFGLHK